jgi:hypothetical protein
VGAHLTFGKNENHERAFSVASLAPSGDHCGIVNHLGGNNWRPSCQSPSQLLRRWVGSHNSPLPVGLEERRQLDGPNNLLIDWIVYAIYFRPVC